MAHPYGLSDDEHAAITALQAGERGPGETSDAWRALIKMSLVWRDEFEQRIRLTPAGERYPA